jgi:hypothetical protein
MTPEKTNYMTQGVDGQKRLKQGPDLSSYRGINVVHSRAFSLETGQQPRDILRRRVRTAEYYRILPHKDNAKREFELYNEERDTWFTMTFQDLLDFSQFNPADPMISGLIKPRAPRTGRTAASSGGYGSVFNPRRMGMYLGAYEADAITALLDSSRNSLSLMSKPMQLYLICDEAGRSLFESHVPSGVGSGPETVAWVLSGPAFNFCRTVVQPAEFPVFGKFLKQIVSDYALAPGEASTCITPRILSGKVGPWDGEQMNFFTNVTAALPFPFNTGLETWTHAADAMAFGVAMTFYREVQRRGGIPVSACGPVTVANDLSSDPRDVGTSSVISLVDAGLVSGAVADKANFFLAQTAKGSVNHPHFFLSRRMNAADLNTFCLDSLGGALARNIIITWPLLSAMSRTDRKTPSAPHVNKPGYQAMFDTEWTELAGDARVAFISMMNTYVSCTKLMFCTRDLLHAELDKSLTKFLSVAFPAPSGGRRGSAHIRSEKDGIFNTFPMAVSSMGHLLHPNLSASSVFRAQVYGSVSTLDSTSGILNDLFLKTVREGCVDLPSWHVFYEYLFGDFSGFSSNDPGIDAHAKAMFDAFKTIIYERFTEDPCKIQANFFKHKDAEMQRLYADVAKPECMGLRSLLVMPHIVGHEIFVNDLMHFPAFKYAAGDDGMAYQTLHLNDAISDVDRVTVSSPNGSDSDEDTFFHSGGRRYPGPGAGGTVSTASKAEMKMARLASRTEFVIVRPNIEHNMLGIILGLGGSELGHTLWGQTELSCYDDSMHGIWGMSYKYHERAIVFNEKNLVRLWDIAYDGYNGGKDDTHVDWGHAAGRNGYMTFQERTMDLGQSYRGPSMMVMKFEHAQPKPGEGATGFQRNWPSPIVFHDLGDDSRGSSEPRTLPIDTENLQVMDVGEFRVFDKAIYKDQYNVYRALMPPFHELHKMRKTAGQASAEAETQSDSLAFQGSMRIKLESRVIQEIHGSGHHGPDYVGAASVRAGKGIKYSGQAPTLSHMV